MGAIISVLLRPFRWLADRWLTFQSREASRRDYIGRLTNQIDQERERHRREIEAKDSVIALRDQENKGLVAMNQVLMAKIDSLMAILGRERAEAEFAARRVSNNPSAGGSA